MNISKQPHVVVSPVCHSALHSCVARLTCAILARQRRTELALLEEDLVLRQLRNEILAEFFEVWALVLHDDVLQTVLCEPYDCLMCAI